MRRRGFTLIELVMVIVILGILAIVAIPRFIDLRADATRAAKQGIEAAIESGAQLWKAKYLINSAVPYNTQYPAIWESCLDADTTADIDAKYGSLLDNTDSGYNPATGKVSTAFTQ